MNSCVRIRPATGLLGAVALVACSAVTTERGLDTEPAASRVQSQPEPPPVASALVETSTHRSNWFLRGSRPEDYAFTEAADPSDPSKMIRTLRFTAKEVQPGFGTLMQSFAADRYSGKRVRFSAKVQTTDVSGWSGLWMRIDGPNGEVLGFDNMQSRPITGTTAPARHDVVLDVPEHARAIVLGVLLAGSGEAILAAPAFDIVGADVHVTSKQPLPDFKP